MNFKRLLIIPLLLISFTGFSQSTDTITDYIKAMFITEQYDQMILEGKKHKPDSLSATALFYVGLANFMRNNDSMASFYLEKSIEKNPFYSNAYYYNGLALSFQKKYNEALTHLRAALKLEPQISDYTRAIGDLFFTVGMTDSALTNYYKAIDMDGSQTDLYLKVADIHLQRKEPQQARNIYYECLYRGDPKSTYYNDCLYNVAFYEMKDGKYTDAEMALTTLLNNNPDDYQAIEKLIQVYFQLVKGGYIQEMRKKLYAAYKDNKLPEEMREQFCFDEFNYRGLTIKACEKFAEPKEQTFQKHIFYILKPDGTVDYTIQTEQNSAVRAMNKSFYLTKTQDNKHYIYMNILFDDEIQYHELKRGLQDIIREKVQPTRVVDIQP